VGWLALAAWLTLAASAGAAQAVVVYLRNGDRVTGEFISETATELTLRSGALGKVTISIGEILRREHLIAATSTNTVAAAPAPIAMPATKTNAPPPKPKHWNSEVQLGLNLRYSTRDQQEALVIAKTTYSKGRFREILDYNFAYGETEEVLTSHRMGGSSKTEWDITPRFYTFGLGGASYDEIRKIERQWEINPGVGYQWFKKPDFAFKTEIGMGYQDQIFSNGREVEAFSGRLAGIFTWRIWDKLLADGKAEYFPNVEAADEYRLRLESTLRYPLLKNLSLNIIVIDLYDTQAPPGVENNDLQVRSALGVKF
jgi:putative salt-induced outer membrane protein YdiY